MTKGGNMKDQTFFLIVFLILIACLSCAYQSETKIDVYGQDVKFPFGITSIKGNQINATINRHMDVRFMYPQKENEN